MGVDLGIRIVEAAQIALARTVGRPVILLDTWSMAPPEGGVLDGLRQARSPAEAVELALGYLE